MPDKRQREDNDDQETNKKTKSDCPECGEDGVATPCKRCNAATLACEDCQGDDDVEVSQICNECENELYKNDAMEEHDLYDERFACIARVSDLGVDITEYGLLKSADKSISDPYLDRSVNAAYITSQKYEEMNPVVASLIKGDDWIPLRHNIQLVLPDCLMVVQDMTND